VIDYVLRALRLPGIHDPWSREGVEEARPLVLTYRTFFDQVIAAGGLDTPAFLTPERQHAEIELDELVQRVHDHKLRVLLRRLVESYRLAWASAPPRQVDKVFDLDAYPYTDEDRIRDGQHAEQVEHARAGQQVAEQLLERLARLERLSAAA
jgi:hypothetical protein